MQSQEGEGGYLATPWHKFGPFLGHHFLDRIWIFRCDLQRNLMISGLMGKNLRLNSCKGILFHSLRIQCYTFSPFLRCKGALFRSFCGFMGGTLG